MKWSRNVLSDLDQRDVNCGDYQECAADEYSRENLCSSSLRCNNLMNVLLRGICFSAVCYLSWMVDIYILLSATIAATAVTNICRSQPLLSDASSEAGGGWRGRSRGGGVHKAAPTLQYCQPWTMHHVKEQKVAICSRLQHSPYWFCEVPFSQYQRIHLWPQTLPKQSQGGEMLISK